MLKKIFLSITFTLLLTMGGVAQSTAPKAKSAHAQQVEKEAKEFLAWFNTLTGRELAVAEENYLINLKNMSPADREIWMNVFGYKKVQSKVTKPVDTPKTAVEVHSLLIALAKERMIQSDEKLVSLEIVRSITNKERATVVNAEAKKVIDSLQLVYNAYNSKMNKLLRRLPEDFDERKSADSLQKIYSEVKAIGYQSGQIRNKISEAESTILVGVDSNKINWSDDKIPTRVLFEIKVAIIDAPDEIETKYCIGIFEPKREGYLEMLYVQPCSVKTGAGRYRTVKDKDAALRYLYFPPDPNTTYD